MRVLITRPERDAARTAKLVTARGHEAVLASLFVVKSLAHRLSISPDAFLATSSNALRALNGTGVDQTKPMFTVGNATATEARNQGFTDVCSADGNGADLAKLVSSQLEPGARLAYLTGKPRDDAAIQALADIYTVDSVETYETPAVDIFPAGAGEELKAGRLDAVLHFSPRAALIFGQLVDSAGLSLQADRLLHVFISSAAEIHRYRNRALASKPTLESMLESLEKS